MLAVALLALTLGKGQASPWPPTGSKVWVENLGAFSARGLESRNLINAPASAFATSPAETSLAPDVLAGLNAGFGEQTDGALGDIHLHVLRGKAALESLKKAATPVEGTADHDFTLRVVVSPEDNTGGHAAGTHLRVTVSSLHRAPDIIGVAETDVIPGSIDLALPLLRSALVVAATEAFADLKTHLQDETVRTRATLTLVIDSTGLNAEQRAYADHELATCAAALAEPLSVTVATHDPVQASRIEYRLRRYEATETEEIFITHFAGQLSFEIGRDGKAKCSTGKTPLEGFDFRVVRDVRAKQVTVHFIPRVGE